ncbi:MAG TPA: AMP-binding protein [Stellaceae bacterium]|nr:AMP-binding protein [Stellaceae bacterium]
MTLLPIETLLNGGRHDDVPVAVTRGHILALGGLRGRIAHNAARLREKHPTRALLVCEDSAEFLVGLLTLAALGCHIVLPPNAQPGTLKLFADSVDFLLTDQPVPDFGTVHVLEEVQARVDRIAINNAAIDFFTSGSTGAMKRVGKSLAVLQREGETLERVWGEALEQDTQAFGTVSHQHIFGLAFKVIWPFLSGRCFAGQNYLTWESLLRDLTPGALIVSSPAHLTRLGGLEALLPVRQPRLIFSAGAPLPPAAVSETDAIFGVAPVEIFGSTETSALAWRRGLSVEPLWRLLPGITARANDDGLLEVRSPFVLGREPCVLSDRVAFTADDSFRFLGRADSVLKIEGKRVNILELEQRIASLLWIKAAAVALMPGARLRLGAVASLSPAGAAALAEQGKFRFVRALRRELLDSHDPAVLPRRWRFIDEIPIDRMGKRRSSEIAALLDTA